ncbi:hypothetical protein XPA_004935 [Xanthoria parietina]
MPPEHRRRLEILMTFHSKPALLREEAIQVDGVQDLVTPCRPRRYDIWKAAARRGTVGQSFPFAAVVHIEAVLVTQLATESGKSMVETREDEHAVVGPGFGTASTPTPGPSHKARTMYVMYPGVDDLAAKRAYSNTRFGTRPYNI